MTQPRISIEQWRALIAVVDAGGYAQAAEAMNKSQSTISYAVAKLEDVLGVKVFGIQGRKAVLTSTGETLYRRAKLLVEQATGLEKAAGELAAGWESEIRIAVDHLFPSELLLQVLDAFSNNCHQTRVQLFETVLSGNDEALLEGKVDVAITPTVPVGFLGDPLIRVRLLPVAAPSHPLHALDRELSYQDLRQHRQMVIRDSGKARRDAGWLGAEQRWTVSNNITSIRSVCMGFAYARLPEADIQEELASGQLKVLPLEQGKETFVDLYLVFADRDYAGPATRRFAEMIKAKGLTGS